MKALRALDEHLEEYLLAIILSAMTIMIGVQIFFRYFISMPLAWTEEIARYLFVWLIYLGGSLAVKKRRHIKVDAVLLLFKDRGKFVLALISNILFFLFAIVITYYGFQIAYKLQFVRNQVSPSVGIPMALAYLSVPTGLLLVCIRLIQDTKLMFVERKQKKAELLEQNLGKED